MPTYPTSADVTAGQPTAVAHYNTLRADALTLGQAAADAVNLGDLLSEFESGFNLEILATTRLRCVASLTVPVCLVVAGYLLKTIINVDLSAGGVPSGVAADWYVFANRTAASTTFTLSVNTSAVEAADQRLVGRFYWDGSAIVKDSIRTELGVYFRTLANITSPQLCQGRITLTTALPVTVADVTSTATVYFTPYQGNVIALFGNNYGWKLYPFTEVSVSVAAINTGKNVDIFGYDNAGTFTLEAVQWTNDSTRATALAFQNGVYVKSGELGKRYLGTVRTDGAGTTCDTIVKRFVWNYYNRKTRYFLAQENTSHVYNGAVRKWNNSDTNNKLEVVIGVAEDSLRIDIETFIIAGAAGSYAMVVFYADGAEAGAGRTGSDLSNYNAQYISIGSGFPVPAPAAGYHYYQLYELGNHAASNFLWMMMRGQVQA